VTTSHQAHLAVGSYGMDDFFLARLCHAAGGDVKHALQLASVNMTAQQQQLRQLTTHRARSSRWSSRQTSSWVLLVLQQSSRQAVCVAAAARLVQIS